MQVALEDLQTNGIPCVYGRMEIVVCHARQEIIQVEARGNRWLHNQLTILGAQAHLSTSTKANLLSETTRDPQAKAVSPLLDTRLHANTPAIRRVYLLFAAADLPPTL